MKREPDDPCFKISPIAEFTKIRFISSLSWGCLDWKVGECGDIMPRTLVNLISILANQVNRQPCMRTPDMTQVGTKSGKITCPPHILMLPLQGSAHCYSYSFKQPFIYCYYGQFTAQGLSDVLRRSRGEEIGSEDRFFHPDLLLSDVCQHASLC
jgi:hypothetical protein